MLAFATDEAIRRRMALYWGITSFLVDPVQHTDEMFIEVDEQLLGSGLVSKGDKVVVISGSPPGIAGSTNDLRVHVVGNTISLN
jgi:pyruvate kinase